MHLNLNLLIAEVEKRIGDWGLGIGDWQSPIPNPQQLNEIRLLEYKY